MTASAHIVTAVIGAGVLSLAWATAQLGWVAGAIAIMGFSVITWYTSTLLADCYRSSDPATGKRNYTYMDAVKANLGNQFSFASLLFVYVSFSLLSFLFFILILILWTVGCKGAAMSLNPPKPTNLPFLIWAIQSSSLGPRKLCPPLTSPFHPLFSFRFYFDNSIIICLLF